MSTTCWCVVAWKIRFFGWCVPEVASHFVSIIAVHFCVFLFDRTFSSLYRDVSTCLLLVYFLLRGGVVGCVFLIGGGVPIEYFRFVVSNLGVVFGEAGCKGRRL